MGATFITPVDVTPGTSGSWVDVDCSPYIASGASGVILHIINVSTSNHYFGIRKNGSSDARNDAVINSSHFWCAIGVDSSRIFEAYVGSTTEIDIYIVGYFDSDAVFFTNAPDKSLSTTGTWTDIDISSDTGADTAKLAFFEHVNTVGPYSVGLRMNGSTDNRTEFSYEHSFMSIGLDASEICEGYIQGLTQDFFLNGYVKNGVTVNANGSDLSLSSTSLWTDLIALASGAVGGIIEVHGTTYYNYGLRKNGSSENILQGNRVHCWGLVECDTSQLIEGYIANTDVDFFLTGYFEPALLTIDLSEAETLLDTLSKSVGKNLSESISLSDFAAMVTSISKTENLTLADTIEALKVILYELSDSMTLDDVIALIQGKVLDEGVSLLDIMNIVTSIVRDENITLTDTMALLTKITQTENITLVDTIARLVTTTKTEAVSLSDIVAPYAFKYNIPLAHYRPKLLVTLGFSTPQRVASEDLYVTE